MGCVAAPCNSRSVFADFSLVTRSQTLPEPTNITDELWRTADELLCQRLPAGNLPVRLLGMGVGGLDDTGLVQRILFDGEEREKQSRVDAVADESKEWFGAVTAAGQRSEPGRKKLDERAVPAGSNQTQTWFDITWYEEREACGTSSRNWYYGTTPGSGRSVAGVKP